jgi:hypothetical protein
MTYRMMNKTLPTTYLTYPLIPNTEQLNPQSKQTQNLYDAQEYFILQITAELGLYQMQYGGVCHYCCSLLGGLG